MDKTIINNVFQDRCVLDGDCGNRYAIAGLATSSDSVYYAFNNALYRYSTDGAFVSKYDGFYPGTEFGDLAFAAQQTSSVPEPEAWGLMLVGFTVVGAVARRRRICVAI